MRVSPAILSLCLSATLAGGVSAAPTEFPYEAIVKNDGVVVRSGPGERYDPTQKLNSGQRVSVQRHDPGGWFMIAPPPGSFSWIDAAYVERTGAETGVVKVPATGDGLPARVVVWIGSQFTEEHKYFGRQLASGDEVNIIEEKTGGPQGPSQKFYKIAPPRLEYRWVKGDFIVPLGEAGNIAQIPASEPSPTADPKTLTTPPVSAGPDQFNPFVPPGSSPPAMSNPGFPPEATSGLTERELSRGSLSAGLPSPSALPQTNSRSQLTELDEQLRAMLAQTPDHWDLAGMEQSYRELQSNSEAGLSSQIGARLAAIESRKKVKAEYDAFVNLTKQTEATDAALLSMQQNIGAGMPIGSVPVELGQPTSFPPQLSGSPEPTPVPSLAPNGPSPSPVSTPADDGVPSMDGAGIVRRLPYAQAGMPQYSLVTPDGRHLAFLHAGQGVRLDQYLGRSIGVIGQRTHDARLRSDLIVVERVTPVQLQP